MSGPGDGTRTPLLMCCGIGASFEVLQPLVDALNPGIEMILFDVPGVGDSPARTVPSGLPRLAFLVSRILNELGYSQVDVLGFSWGGALAQQLAAQHHNRCRRLVLVSTGTGALMVPGSPKVLAKMASPRTPPCTCSTVGTSNRSSGPMSSARSSLSFWTRSRHDRRPD